MSQENVDFLAGLFRDGKVLRYQEFYDEQDALAALDA